MQRMLFRHLVLLQLAASAALALAIDAYADDIVVAPPHDVASVEAARGFGFAVRVFASSSSTLTVEICRSTEGTNSFMFLEIRRSHDTVFSMGADPDRETKPGLERYAFDVSREWIGDVAMDIAVYQRSKDEPPVWYAFRGGLLSSAPVEEGPPGQCSREGAQASKH